MSLPLVSIIIPVYNQQSEYLRMSLESALNQTYSNIEIIVSNNHSTNETQQILQEYSNDKLKIIMPEHHLSIIDHFTFSASKAKGEYISFLSSDDLIYPECIAKSIQPLLENKHLSFSYCESNIIDAHGKRISIVRSSKLATGIYDKTKIAKRMYNHSEYWIIGAVIRHELYKKIGFTKNIIATDWIMGIQLLKYGNVAYCNEILSAIRFHERAGEAKEKYIEQHILHQKQRIIKHNTVINDQELLDAISISKTQATNYLNEEISKAIIQTIREYHDGKIRKETAKEILELYKEQSDSFNFRFLGCPSSIDL